MTGEPAKRALIYKRVGSLKQEEEDRTLKEQKESFKMEAQYRGIEYDQ